MNALGRSAVLAALAFLLTTVPATAAVPTGTYTGKLKDGGKISFKVTNKAKRVGSITLSGALPWKCDPEQYGPTPEQAKPTERPGSGPFTLGRFYTNDMNTWVPLSSKGKFAGHDRDGKGTQGDGWHITGEIRGTATSSGTASGIVAVTARKKMALPPGSGDEDYPDSIDVNCTTSGRKFTAKRR